MSNSALELLSNFEHKIWAFSVAEFLKIETDKERQALLRLAQTSYKEIGLKQRMHFSIDARLSLKVALHAGLDFEESTTLVAAVAQQKFDQWAQLIHHMMNSLTPGNVARWERQIKTEYSDLSEAEKELDRVCAHQVLSIIQEHMATC